MEYNNVSPILGFENHKELSTNFQPFALSYSAAFPEILHKLNATLAISTYQAGKVIFLSALHEAKLIQLPRSFKKAMGIAVEDEKMLVACLDEVILLKNSRELAFHYPKKPKTYDSMFLPRLTFHTGAIDVHDIDFAEGGICAVNTNFSCIIRIDEEFSFTPIWKPDFISKITAGDRCHLNGMAVENGKIKYVSAFSQTDEPRAWKANILESGVLINYETKEVEWEGLSMPHSPRVYNNKLYVLTSGDGGMLEIDPVSKEKKTIIKLDAFVRGLTIHEGLAFIGTSKLRENSSTFAHLPIAKKALKAGVSVVHIESGTVIANLHYNNSVDEIYDVQLITEKRRPSILNTITDDHKMGLSTPDNTFWGRKKES